MVGGRPDRPAAAPLGEVGGGRAPRHRAGRAGTQPGPVRGARGPGANLFGPGPGPGPGSASFGGPKCGARSPLWLETRCLRRETTRSRSDGAGRSEDGPAMRRTRSSSCRRPARRSSVTSRSRRESRSRASEAARMAAAKFFRAVRASPVPRAQCHARELGSKILSRCVSASARQSRAQCGAR